MRRKRFQRGYVRSDGRYWLGRYREVIDSVRKDRTKVLGKIGEMSKSAAESQLAEILRPLNIGTTPATRCTLSCFVEDVFLPWKAKRWKGSTLQTNTQRIRRDIVGPFGGRELTSLMRDELQAYLDSKGHLSFSVVDHLKWDFRAIYEMAISEGLAIRNPAAMLVTPRECAKPEHHAMSVDGVKLALTVLPLRERLIFKLATLAGMRPGEIFGLKRGHIADGIVHVQQRIYRGQVDTPKNEKSRRHIPLSTSVRQDLAEWLAECPYQNAEDWLFPSERRSPLSKDNALARHILPALKAVGLNVNYQVMRRTHASLMHEMKVDPKVVADLMGHDIGVNLDVYTQTSVETRRNAMEMLDSALR